MKAGVAVVVALVLASCGTSPEQRVADEISATMRDFKVPANAELPPTLAPALRELADGDPALARRLPAIAAEEKRMLAELRRQVDGRLGNDAAPAGVAMLAPQAARRPRAEARGSGPLAWLVPSAHAQVLDYLDAADSALGGALTGAVVSGLLGDMAERLAKSPDPTVEMAKLIGKDGEKVEMNADIAKDGTVTSTIDSNIEAAVLGIKANSRTSVSTRSLCPDAEGRVNLTVRLRTDASTGRATATGERYEAQVSIVVDETAEIASVEIKTKYDVAKAGAGGGMRTTGRLTLVSSDFKTFTPSDHSGESSGDPDEKATLEAMKKAVGIGAGAVVAAKSHWQNGKCIEIVAASPGSVKPSTVSQIDVKTRHRHEGAEVRAGIRVTLEGGASIDPAAFASPGTFSHTAVAEERKTMKLILRATSRRGAAEETLTVKTRGRGYAIYGGGGEFRGTGKVCDLMEPFFVSGNANITVNFDPYDETRGTYSYAGRISAYGYSAKLGGSGTYRVEYVDGKPFRILASGPGEATSRGRTYKGAGSEVYVLTPAEC